MGLASPIRSRDPALCNGDGNVDLVAIAGAIAWEALQNVTPSVKAVGPGKVHALFSNAAVKFLKAIGSIPLYCPKCSRLSVSAS